MYYNKTKNAGFAAASLIKQVNKMSNEFSKGKVQKSNRLLFTLGCWGIRAYCRLAGIRISFTNKCGKMPERPSIVLCNHGSFLDFAYTGAFLRKCHPKAVIARYYFYHKWLSRLLKLLGGFPKSQLEVDVESTKNCLRVLQDGVLVMMPEARVCCVGRLEAIQEGTYSFLKKVKVPVYTVRLNGDYLSYPKWGKGFRRGAVVESELDALFSVEDLGCLSVEEIKQAVEERLRYDDFQWLQTRPDVHYRSGRLAEGLENILTVCPVCMGRHTITTKKHEVFCEHCGKLTTMDDRYAFSEDFRFANFVQWYDWQTGILREEIFRDPDYAMESEVELQLPSEDGKTIMRTAGRGKCTLTRAGLTYRGTKDGEPYEISFPLKRIFRLIFGAGEGFQVYNGPEMLYFLPDERRSAVDWYLASEILYEEAYGKQKALSGTAR